MMGFIVIKDNDLKDVVHHINVDHIIDICQHTYEGSTAITTTDGTTYYVSDPPEEIIKRINYAKMGIKYEKG